MSRQRRRARIALLAALSTLAIPAAANAGVTGITVTSNASTGQVCADVTPATTSLEVSFTTGGTRLGGLTGQGVVATACAGGPGRSIIATEGFTQSLDGVDLTVRGNDESADTTLHIPVGRADLQRYRLAQLAPGSAVNGVPASGPTFDMPLPPGVVLVTSPLPGGRTATVRLPQYPFTYNYVSSYPREGTEVRVVGPAPGIPVHVLATAPDGRVVIDRTLPPAVPGTGEDVSARRLPELPSGTTVRIVQDGVMDRTLAMGTAEVRPDGFRAALPPGATEGAYDPATALHPASDRPGDPLGPCHQLFTGATTPGSGCSGVTGPRTQVTATGLTMAVGDGVRVSARFPGSDITSLSAERPGVLFVPQTGDIYPLGVTGAFRADLVLPGGRTLTRQGVLNRLSEASRPFTPFPLHIPAGARLVMTHDGGRLEAPLALDAGEAAGRVSGRTVPGARVRVMATRGQLVLADAITTAAADGTFAAVLPPLPANTRILLSAGDPATGTLARAELRSGHPWPRITGPADGQPVRGAVTFTAEAGAQAPSWAIGSDAPRFGGQAAVTVDTRAYEDGPLRVQLNEDGTPSDYRYVTVDNTAPSGGAGADQRIRPGQEAVFVTGASDDGGLATVSARFGDRTPAVQVAGGAAGTIRHRFAKGGRYTVRVTLTDRAGNVTQDTAVVTVMAAAPACAARCPPPSPAARRSGSPSGHRSPGGCGPRSSPPRACRCWPRPPPGPPPGSASPWRCPPTASRPAGTCWCGSSSVTAATSARSRSPR
ncbi:MAG: PKD domain-containing protein [Thermoleophilia bacterium]